ncbi:MAG TPA: glutathione transferase [Burkholderiales bacterium]|jgi:Glutathione S-transferase
MSAPQLTLYVDSNFLSPYAMSAFVALHEKKLPFTLEPLNLSAGENKGPDFQSTSLTCRVPTLVHGDFSLSESSAISEYLDEEFPGPRYAALYPGDRRARARARQIQAWIRSDFLPVRRERPTDVVFREPIDKPLSDAAQASAEKLLHAADALVGPAAGPLFGAWSIADTDLALMLNRLVLNGDPVPEKLTAYAHAQWQRSSVGLWVARARALRR